MPSITVSSVPIVTDKSKWTEKELADLSAKGFRSRREGEFPICAAEVRPADYDNDLKRGTVEYQPDWRNYSNHVVHIPAGTVVLGCNFMQAAPNTQGITSDGPITLIECNLTNVKLDPSWVLEKCNTAQAWLVDEGGIDLKRKWICAHPDQLKGNEVAPVNVVTRRD